MNGGFDSPHDNKPKWTGLIVLLFNLIFIPMKVYTFEIGKDIFEYYDIRNAKKKSLQIAKETNQEILVTCINLPTYKQDWFTALPNGEFLTDVKGFRADN